MSITTEFMLGWLEDLLGVHGFPSITLDDYLRDIPRLESLRDVPSGTVVLIRGDTDCKPGDQIGKGDIRLTSMQETLQFGREKGWKQVILGHVGREPEKSLDKVAKRLGQILKIDVPLITDWLDPATNTIQGSAVDLVKQAAPGGVLMLQNTRAYEIERVLWKAKPADLPKLAGPLAKIANEFAEKLGTVYINEAFSAGSLDTSSTVLPAAMRRVALGAYVSGEFSGPMLRCLQAQLVIFSGLKAEKLDDMETIIQRGHVRRLFCAGSLAMALRKADAQLNGGDFCLGVAEDPAHADKPYYVPPDRVEQARRMLTGGRKNGIEFVLPVDCVLQDGRVAEHLLPTDQQFDIGPKSTEFFEAKVGEFIRDAVPMKAVGKAPVAFHNGVFGMFEDPRFESGTREFTKQLKRMTESGIEVYVGGGEGGAALEKYGSLDWVTHCFTAGGTVLNALGSAPVPYLVALRRAAKGKS